MLKILTVPAETEILRRKSEPIDKIDAELLAFLKELGETLTRQKDPAGVGLSAIQVGKAIKVFAMFLPIIRGQGSGVRGQKHEGVYPTLRGRTLEAKPKLTFYINPEIVEHAAQMTLGEELTENRKQRTVNRGIQRPASSLQRPFLEGCLSVPRIYGAVMRWSWIRARTIIIDENQLQLISNIRYQISDIRLDGLHSRIFQHELDHLNGILFTDQVLLQGNKLYREEGKEMVAMEM